MTTNLALHVTFAPVNTSRTLSKALIRYRKEHIFMEIEKPRGRGRNPLTSITLFCRVLFTSTDEAVGPVNKKAVDREEQ
jgi:hypothetical protein